MVLSPASSSRRSRSVDEGGLDIAEDAYPVARADVVLSLLGDAGVVVLGGDFYDITDGRPRPTGMNWYYEGTDAAASLDAARRRIGQPWVEPSWHITFVWR